MPWWIRLPRVKSCKDCVLGSDCDLTPLRFEDEIRQACIGKLHGKHWTAIMTCRGCVVRLISVRRSHKDEEKAYEDEGI